jgi:hypothetical protein
MFSKGQGPKKISNPYKVKINPFTNTIFILNEHGFKLKQFSRDGDFLDNIILPEPLFGNFEFISKDTMIYISDCKYGQKQYYNFDLLNIDKRKIERGFLKHSILKRDDTFNIKQKFVIRGNTIWTSTIDTVDLKAIAINTGKMKRITIPGHFQKNIIHESDYHGQNAWFVDL